MPNTHYGSDTMWLEYKVEPTDERRNQLIERYLPLVRYNAERILKRLPGSVELDDLVSAGVFGLIDAIKAFDLERFTAWQTKCIRAWNDESGKRANDYRGIDQGELPEHAWLYLYERMLAA